MEFLVLNQAFEVISVVDRYESILWVDRYDTPGEFEIYTPVTTDILENVVVNNYLWFKDSKKLMIVEDLEIKTDTEDGNTIKITGRSLESILDRRCIIGVINVSGNLQEVIHYLLDDNIINPSDPERKISNFIFKTNSDPRVTDYIYDGQFDGGTLLEAIESICQSASLGFQILLNMNNQFEFSLYAGTDRSYNQEDLPWVVFKPSFDNIVNSVYTENNSDAKTFCYVHSEYTEYHEESSESETIDVIRTAGSGSGLHRKEVYVSSSISKEEDMTLDDFYRKLDQDASASLSERKVKKKFDGECETERMFKYDRDFFLGDICQVANEYGFETPSRVSEYMWSVSSSGVKNYPTFTAIN